MIGRRIHRLIREYRYVFGATRHELVIEALWGVGAMVMFAACLIGLAAAGGAQ